MATTPSNGVAESSNDVRQQNIAKLEELMSEGQKKFIIRDLDSAVDIFSEASRLADLIYGVFAPETFNASLKYGHALVAWAAQQYSVFKIKTKDEAESTDEEEEDQSESVAGDEDEAEASESENEAETSEDKPADSNGNATETANETLNEEQKEVDVTLSPEEEEFDEFESILNDAWTVLEVAKKTCEKQLLVVTEEKDIRHWKLNLSEPLYFLGQVLILSEKPEEAKDEWVKSLEIKQQYLSEDNRELAANLFQIANTFCQMHRYNDARIYFEKALECLNKKIASLEADKDNKESAEEIEEIRSICGDIQEKINDAIDSEKAQATIKLKFQEEKEKLTAHTSNVAPVNDASNLIKRRHPDQNESEDVDAKKSKKP